MVYSNNIVAVIKCNGKIVREDKDLVRLPFGSEYSILIKNLSPKDASVSINIDGKDVLSHKTLLIKSHESHELNGFLTEDNVVRNRFKFIQKTENIINHRGDNIDDGFINISWQFQKTIPTYTYYSHSYFPKTEFIWDVCTYTCSSSSSTFVGNNEGITVKGSQTNQQYSEIVPMMLEEEVYNLIIRLHGFDGFETQKEPVYTTTKLKCETCGRKCKSNMKFCPECGTSLI